jgi:uncharacterized phage protein (TIGR02218 family)
MKTATTQMAAHLNSDCTTLASLYKITRKDGQVFTFTDHDKDIVYGGSTYEASLGFSPTAIQNKADLSVDNQEITAFIDSAVIKESDIRFGIWDAADVEIRLVNWADLSMGEIKMRKGELGNVHMKNGTLTAEFFGITNKLQVLQGRTFGPACDAELGDTRCKATVPVENNSINYSQDAHHIVPNAGLAGAAGYYSNLSAGQITVQNVNGVSLSSQTGSGTIAATGTVISISTAVQSGGNTVYTFSLASGPPPKAGQTIVISGMSNVVDNGTFAISFVLGNGTPIWVAGYYDDGILTFTSGINSGLSFQIATWDGITLALKNSLFSAPSNGDTFTISPGCAHNMTDCVTKFNNLVNFRGFPSIPGQDSVLQYPDATT